jgi:hypothetical protein
MTVLQVVGSILGIPLGLASGYSIYHANFSVEARCHGLRANIISMLDKSADASTLRMLVRRDVVDFEKTCGAVDPDAVSAFKTLLTSGKLVARTPEPAEKTARAPEHRAHPVAKHEAVKHEAVKHEAAKRAPAKVAAATEARRKRQEAASADVRWVASVRQALLHAPADHAEEPAMPARAAARAPAPRLHPVRNAHAAAMSLAPPANAPSAVAAPQRAAPALPPAGAVANVPAQTADHPVPPAPIPDSAPPPQAAAAVPAAEPQHSGIRDAIADIPLLGHLIGK